MRFFSCSSVLLPLSDRAHVAGTQRGSRFSQSFLNPSRGRVRAAEHAPRGPCRLFKRRHSSAEIVERGAGVKTDRRRITKSHLERDVMIISENASRHGNHLAQECLGFFDALEVKKGRRVVAGC